MSEALFQCILKHCGQFGRRTVHIHVLGLYSTTAHRFAYHSVAHSAAVYASFFMSPMGRSSAFSHHSQALQLRNHVQAVSKALALQMQQLQQQVTDGITAAATLRLEKQAAADQLHQVCSQYLRCQW